MNQKTDNRDDHFFLRSTRQLIYMLCIQLNHWIYFMNVHSFGRFFFVFVHFVHGGFLYGEYNVKAHYQLTEQQIKVGLFVLGAR